MPQSLARYWSRLEDSVHPDDKETFRRVSDHGFNLDYPPPAFIGDIVNAPVIILDNNGGYDDETSGEFPDQEAHDEYRETLAVARPVDPEARSMASYYLRRNYTEWLISGEAALVNGVAYRSADGKAKGVGLLTSKLPSARFHRQWLREILLPLAQRGERFVVVHRWGCWNRATDVFSSLPTSISIRSRGPIGGDLTKAELSAGRTFLAAR